MSLRWARSSALLLAGAAALGLPAARLPASEREVVPGAIVVLRPVDPSDPRSYLVRADERGRFVFEHIPPGRYRLNAARPARPGNGVVCVVSEGEPPGSVIALLDGDHLAQDLVVRAR